MSQKKTTTTKIIEPAAITSFNIDQYINQTADDLRIQLGNEYRNFYMNKLLMPFKSALPDERGWITLEVYNTTSFFCNKNIDFSFLEVKAIEKFERELDSRKMPFHKHLETIKDDTTIKERYNQSMIYKIYKPT